MIVYKLSEDNHGTLAIFSTIEKAIAYALTWAHETTYHLFDEDSDIMELHVGIPEDYDTEEPDCDSVNFLFWIHTHELDPTAPE